MNLKIKDILDCTNGILISGNENTECQDFSIDTRNIKVGDTYIGIKGENNDGNLFWEIALQQGADTVIIENVDIQQSKIEEYKNKNIIKVENTRQALKKIASAKRKLYKDLIVVGVTGSVGKTTTKDIIANVLSQEYSTLKTEGNNNNDIGLPLTILRLKDHKAAVIEMGMNHKGEISELTKIARPTISVITNVGTSHIGNLGSQENILKAKLEILEGMEEPLLISNNDNNLLNKWNANNNDNIKLYTFGIENKSDYIAIDINKKENSTEFICNNENERIKINLRIGGEVFVLNSLCAIIVGKILNLTNEQIQKGIESFQLTKKRMEVIKLNNNITIINDSYNASLDSMKASLKYLAQIEGKRKIAVLGDMFELGDFSEKLHREVGKEIPKNKIDLLFIIGEDIKYVKDEAINSGMKEENIFYFKDKKHLEENLKKQMKDGDVILFKASNGMKLFEIVENLK